MPEFSIREAVEADFPAITSIYAGWVNDACGTFELVPPTEDEMKARFAYIRALGMPYLVAEKDGQVIGYAYAGPFRAREAYRYMVEDSIYIDPAAKGLGVGGALLDRLILECEQKGARQMVAVIGDSENESSIGLHRSRGFADSGRFTSAGWKLDGWRDVIFMQKPLGAADTTPPDGPALLLSDKGR
ncbi:GNAT family N-acetyltransferase [uncultured Brevundimonas sp.]|uniref:GNAT family N-acetyltransferase n=1 Tax=uncultured Brevundimonas sp. TaxID=213418 RepID=UPI002627ABC5|nr:GNAT family N-acetyltransferase [uncultured Brevundimonas sp.]